MNRWEALRAGVSVTEGEIEIFAVLAPGTIVIVDDFDTTRSFVGDIHAPIGHIEDPRYRDLSVEFFSLFEGLGGADSDPQPDPKYLRFVNEE